MHWNSLCLFWLHRIPIEQEGTIRCQRRNWIGFVNVVMDYPSKKKSMDILGMTT